MITEACRQTVYYRTIVSIDCQFKIIITLLCKLQNGNVTTLWILEESWGTAQLIYTCAIPNPSSLLKKVGLPDYND